MPPTPSRSRRHAVLGALLAGSLAGCAFAAARGDDGALDEKYRRWAMYEGDAGAAHFSSLAQIDRSNVHQLEVAWTYDRGSAGMNPLVIDTMMYVVGEGGIVAAIHAATGREIWTHRPDVTLGRNRGLLYWESDDRTDRRIFITKGNFLRALDARTGLPIPSFGVGGRADVREGVVGRDLRGLTQNPSSPGTVWEDLVILGSGPGEAWGSGPGDIRAFDARTGRMMWIFHTIPHPGEYGYETWPADAWQRVGGANNWGGMSVDEDRGIVYVPLGSATYDFYGADRLGDNLFANSLVALDARTGRRLWHYQTVRHDLWDYDLTATPTLLTIRQDGRARDVVAQATKQGFVFVFDRVTGEPIWPIEERPVPPSDMPGEVAAPTQPVPTWPKPFAVQTFRDEDVNPYLPQAERDSILRRLAGIRGREETLFTPPSTVPTMQMPGNRGGANWGSTAADPRDGSFYVLTHNIPTVLQLERIVPGVFGTGTSAEDRGQSVYQQSCRTCHQADLRGQPPIIPSLVGVTDRLTPDEIHVVLRQGRGNMPGFPTLTGQEVTALLSYLAAPELATPLEPAGQRAGDLQAAPRGEETGPLRYQTGYGYFTASGGMYAIKPPWMTLTKYDMNTGEILWQTPAGEVPSLVARGITDLTGASIQRGGPAVTAGGLVFMVTLDKLRAYDSDTGKEIWSARLPANAEGIPAIYEVGGRQFIVVGVGVSSGLGGYQPLPLGQSGAYVAFALPAGAR